MPAFIFSWCFSSIRSFSWVISRWWWNHYCCLWFKSNLFRWEIAFGLCSHLNLLSFTTPFSTIFIDPQLWFVIIRLSSLKSQCGFGLLEVVLSNCQSPFPANKSFAIFRSIYPQATSFLAQNFYFLYQFICLKSKTNVFCAKALRFSATLVTFLPSYSWVAVCLVPFRPNCALWSIIALFSKWNFTVQPAISVISAALAFALLKWAVPPDLLWNWKDPNFQQF